MTYLILICYRVNRVNILLSYYVQEKHTRYYFKVNKKVKKSVAPDIVFLSVCCCWISWLWDFVCVDPN